MEDVDDWIDEANREDFATAITTVTAKLYNLIDYKRTKNDRLTGPLCVSIKKILDYVSKRALENYKKTIQFETRIEEATNYQAAMEELSKRISRQSTGVLEEAASPVVVAQQKYKSDFPVIIAVDDAEQDMEEIKRNVKDICKSNVDLPSPKDVVITRTRQVILKMKNREETETMRLALSESEALKEKTKISVPRKRRERLLLLSLDPDIEEEVVRSELRKTLDDLAPEGHMIRNLTNRLRDTTLTAEAKGALQDLYLDNQVDFEIIRQIKTRNGKTNWLIDVDGTGKEILLAKRRICIDFERYRIVEFLPIVRCFKCQQYGHYAGSCKNRMQCAKCSEEHSVKECKSSVTCCANCYFKDATGDTIHRADSSDCPIYKAERNRLIPSRS